MPFDTDRPRTPCLDEEESVPFRARKGRLTDWDEHRVDPQQATTAEPGTSEKVVTLAARYAAGLPLWNDDDRDGHGSPRDEEREQL